MVWGALGSGHRQPGWEGEGCQRPASRDHHLRPLNPEASQNPLRPGELCARGTPPGGFSARDRAQTLILAPVSQHVCPKAFPGHCQPPCLPPPAARLHTHPPDRQMHPQTSAGLAHSPTGILGADSRLGDSHSPHLCASVWKRRSARWPRPGSASRPVPLSTHPRLPARALPGHAGCRPLAPGPG